MKMDDLGVSLFQETTIYGLKLLGIVIGIAVHHLQP